MKIAVAGATGNVAGRALEKLVQAGAEVTVLVRHPEKLPASLRSKVHVEEGSLDDAAFVTRATRGAQALFWLTPPNFAAQDLKAYVLGLAENAAKAIRENKIGRVVFLSTHGAERDGFGPVSYAGKVEKLLESAAPNALALRAGSFMENLLNSLATLKEGRLFGTNPPDKKYPLVATRDIGDAAAHWLLDEKWTGHRTVGVDGPVDSSAREQVETLSRVLGKPVTYQQIPAEQVKQNFLKMGATPSVAGAYAEMMGAFAAESYTPTEKRTAQTTTPTTLEQFAREVLAPRLR
jgi:uncharacterized protein YbjT (DUF2867 family)